MTEEKKFWWTRLMPGVQPKNLASYYFLAFVTIGLAVLINTLQPYLLTNFLKIHPLKQGSIAGNATAIAEIVLFISVLLWGASSDRIGRRAVYVWGFIFTGIGYGLMPMVSTPVTLYAFRCVYVIGAAATTGMLATIIGDYVINPDRGKATGIMGLMNAMGAAICAVLLSKMPFWYQGTAGGDGLLAGWYAYLTVTVACMVFAFIAYKGLATKEIQTGKHEDNIPFKELVTNGWKAGTDDTGVMLSYVSAFVARADLAVAGVFLPQWCVSYLITQEGDMAGLSQEKLVELSNMGIAKGGALIGIIGSAGLIAAPVFGIMCDRMNRTTVVGIALLINVVGYGATYFVDDPTSGLIFGVAFIIGAGEISGVISSQVLAQQQAPAMTRGSVLGFFNMCGALGIMLNSFIGGQLFQNWKFQGPFLWLAFLNLLVALACFALRNKVKPPKDAFLGIAGGPDLDEAAA